MALDWLQPRLPRSLFGRAALTLTLLVAALLAIVSGAFVQRYYDDVTRQMTRALALDLRLLAAAAAGADRAGAPDRVAALGRALEIDVALPAPAPPASSVPGWDLAGRAMTETLEAELPATLATDLAAPRRVAVWIDTPQGPLRAEFARRRVAAANPHQLLVITGVMGVAFTAVAALVLRAQLRPVRRLAAAATAYGRGRVVPFRPSGAAEVRAAGAAFLEMRARIERQTQARTAMLAGVSHDLRTPLTRLRLGLSLLDDPEADAMARDVDDMARMVDTFLDFAKADADAQEPTDVPALLREAAKGAARGGRTVALALAPAPGPVALRPLALRRAVENLLGNALRHGREVRLSLAWEERAVRVTVEDDGPGIPPEQREEAMRPFARLDVARNQDRPGVGLGLAIAGDVARAHGGHLRLGRSEALGGLRADLVLAR